MQIDDDLFLDFTVATSQGCERIARLAFDYARKTGKNRVSCVTKANIIKTTDGKFLDTCQKVAKEYPEVEFDDWYIDIMTAKLLDDKRRRDFKVVVLPNLYGDIITDEAAEIQGGVGTAGSANIGKRYAMFEAITVRHRVWCRKAVQSTPTRLPCCAHRLCCWSISARSNWRKSSTVHWISACLKRKKWSLPVGIPARLHRNLRITCWIHREAVIVAYRNLRKKERACGTKARGFQSGHSAVAALLPEYL